MQLHLRTSHQSLDFHRNNLLGKPLSMIAIMKLSSGVPKVNMMGSILQHHKYKEMKSKLSKRNRKILGPGSWPGHCGYSRY